MNLSGLNHSAGSSFTEDMPDLSLPKKYMVLKYDKIILSECDFLKCNKHAWTGKGVDKSSEKHTNFI